MFLCIFSLPVSGRIIRLTLPLYLEHEGGEGTAEEVEHLPYRQLSVTITLQLPTITIRPSLLSLTPVPLRRSVTATLTLLAGGYTKSAAFFIYVFIHPCDL